MKRTGLIYGLILLSLAVVAGVWWESSRLSQAEREVAVEAVIQSARSCETTADCTIVPGQCPFGCYVAVNKAEVQRVTQAMDDYHAADYRQQCVYSCIANPDYVCEENQCEVVIPKPQ